MSVGARILARLRRPLSTLDSYILSRFVVVYVASLVSFAMIFVLLDLVENLDEFNKQTNSAGELVSLLVRYYGVNLPIVFCQILGPIVCLTAGLFTLTIFQRSNELVPMLANGRSIRRVCLPMIIAACVLAVGTFAVQEVWIPKTRDVFRELSGKRGEKLETHDQKYSDSGREILLSIQRYLIAEQRALGVLVLPTNPRRGTDEVIHARSMEWVTPELGAGYWLLKDGWVQRYQKLEGSQRSRLVTIPQAHASGAPDRLSESFVERRFETAMIPEDLEIRDGQVIHMTLADLQRKRLESDDKGWTIKYYSRFFHPLNSVILLLLGLPVLMYFGTKNIFFGAVIAACVSTAFFVVVAFVQELGAEGVMPASIGAAGGPLLFLALSLTWMRYVKT